MPGNQNRMLQQNWSKPFSKSLFYHYFKPTILQLTSVSEWSNTLLQKKHPTVSDSTGSKTNPVLNLK